MDGEGGKWGIRDGARRACRRDVEGVFAGNAETRTGAYVGDIVVNVCEKREESLEIFIRLY